jgi:hypothetical protein
LPEIIENIPEFRDALPDPCVIEIPGLHLAEIEGNRGEILGHQRDTLHLALDGLAEIQQGIGKGIGDFLQLSHPGIHCPLPVLVSGHRDLLLLLRLQHSLLELS